MKVTFHPVGALADAPPPTPAHATLPEWYRNLAAEIPGGHTVKACVPFMEAMTAGFVIPLPCDIVVRDDMVFPVDGHTPGQIGNRSGKVHKFVSPWLVRTEPGVSCLFKQPEQRDLPFRIFEGIVDTDTHPLAVNFPFVFEKPFSGIIPKGTPMVQVVPFRREAAEMGVGARAGQPATAMQPGDYRRRWWHRRAKPTNA